MARTPGICPRSAPILLSCRIWAGATSAYCVEITEQNFQEIVETSRTAPLLLVFYSPSQMAESVQLADDLPRLWAEAMPQGPGTYWPRITQTQRTVDWTGGIRDVLRTIRALRRAAETIDPASGRMAAFCDSSLLYSDDNLGALGFLRKDMCQANLYNHPGIREHIIEGLTWSRIILD